MVPHKNSPTYFSKKCDNCGRISSQKKRVPKKGEKKLIVLTYGGDGELHIRTEVTEYLGFRTMHCEFDLSLKDGENERHGLRRVAMDILEQIKFGISTGN